MRYSVIGATVEQVERAGGQDIKEARSTGIVFATLTETQATQLRSMGFHVREVARVSADIIGAPVAPPAPIEAEPVYSPFSVLQIVGLEELRQFTDPPLYGKGYNAAIVDTGIRDSHAMVGGNIVFRKNYTTNPAGDGFDHGTGLASIFRAVCPEAGILDLKVLDNRGEGTEEAVVLAIDDCIDLRDTESSKAPVLINLSLGSIDDGDPLNPLRVACRAATQKGMWVNAAAGNAGPGPGSITNPAVERYVFATGSVKYLPDAGPFIISEFSSRGPTQEGIIKPDAVFFGENIEMASSINDTARIAKSGTSFAAPFNTGIAVLYMEGHVREVSHRVPLPIPEPGSPEALAYIVSMEELLDIYLKKFCVKPAEAPRNKDSWYGEGLPFGPLITQAFRRAAAPSFEPVLAPVLLIGMMSMLTKVMK